MPIVQAKLRIGSSDDKYEKEANRIADQVMRMPKSEPVITDARNLHDTVQSPCDGSGELFSGCEGKLQRQPEDQKEEELVKTKASPAPASISSALLASKINSIDGRGQALPESTHAFFEPRFGEDLSGVRVHAGAEAVEAARSINARAFTLGSDLVFGENEYHPDSKSGRELMAHELTHVIQQGGRTGERCACAKVMRKERDAAPAIKPTQPAENWFYADDPTGHVASIYFGEASARLSEDDKDVLDRVNFLLADPTPPDKVKFEGYADRTGDARSNKELSDRRAREVAAHFSDVPSEISGFGEQGPKPADATPAELSHYRRADVIIVPPRPTTLRPYEPPRKPGVAPPTLSQELLHQQGRAVEALEKTLAAVASGMRDDATMKALKRYFPHPRYQSVEFLRTLEGEIRHVRDHIEAIRYREFPTEQSVRRQCNRSNYRSNPEICRIVLSPPSEDPAAFGFPLENPERVVLSPDWYKLPDPASVLVHEAAHLLLGLRGHPTEVPHRDPYAIQGFVAALGSLRADHSDGGIRRPHHKGALPLNLPETVLP